MNFDANTIKNVFDNAVNKTEKAIDIQKKRFAVSTAERLLNESYEDLGRAYYSLVNSGGSDSKFKAEVENLIAVVKNNEDALKETKDIFYKAKQRK